MPLNYQTLLYNPINSQVLSISLKRPPAANALNTQMALELIDVFSYISEKNNTFRAVILSGTGKHFCAGADLKERLGMNEAAWKSQHQTFREARDALLYCPVPVIAAVHGAVYAGGLELALACDFIYAGDDTRFALTEATLGIMPGMGGTQTLSRAIGTRRAREIIYSGKPFSAHDAYEWGMVNHLCASEAVLEKAIACAQTIADNAPLSISAIKGAIARGEGLPLENALQGELTAYDSLLNTKDRYEGIAAFNEKRKAIFTGE